MNAIEFNTRLQGLNTYLRPFAIKLTRDEDDAKDLMQETMVKAISNRTKFTNGTNLKAWLYTIMRNTFITDYHRAVRRNTFIDRTDNLHFINSPGAVLENQSKNKFIGDDLKAAIKSIKKDYSKPFMMYFKGWKYHEIADMLEIPIGTVKNRIHIARKLLKEELHMYAVNN